MTNSNESNNINPDVDCKGCGKCCETFEKVCEDLISYLKCVLPSTKAPVMKCRDCMQNFECPHDTRSRPHTSTPEMCKHWVSSANLKSDFRDQDIGMCYCNKSMYEHDTAIRTEERNKILRLVESDEWQKEHDEQTRNDTLDKFKEVIRLHDEDELLYPDLYNEFLVIYKSLRKERP